jgi:hypothetical protein
MERHDTHILSDSQEDDEKEENDHFYSFNNSKNSDSNSLKNTIHSNSKRGSKFNLNDLIQTKNNDENEIYNESLVSSKDLEELFYDEKRFTKQIIKKNEKDKESEKDKEKEKKVENNNVENNNKSMDKIELKNSLMESNVDNNKNKLNETEINKIPDNIKIKMIKLNYDDNISVFNNLLTYTPNLINKLKLKKTKKKRNCISFEKDKEKVKNKLKNNQNNKKEEIKKNIRIQKKKKINLPQSDDTPSEKSSFNNNINNNNIENKKMKNLFDILKNNNLKSFKISTNSFTIMTKNTNSSNDKSKTAKKKLKANNSIGFELNNKIQKQNEFYLKHDYEYNLLKRYNFSPGKIQINGKKRFQILQSKQENNKLHQEYDSKFIITNNNSQYSLRYYNNNNSSNNNNNSNNKYIQNRHSNEFHSNYIPEYDNEFDEDYDYNENEYNNNYNEDEYYSIINRMKRMNMYNTNKNLKKNSGLKLKTDKKIKILYDLYCKRPKKEAKSINRINSAYSLKNGKTRFTNLPNVNYMDLNNNLENRDYMIKNRLYNNNNNKNWLLKLIKVQKDKNMYHYEKHFGNNESCPLCQQMDKKNEEQIRKIGVYHMASDIKKSDSRSNSKKKRRINSAFPNSHIKNFNAQFSNEINKSGTRNNLHYNKSTAFFNEYNLSKNMINGNKMKRKLQFNNRQKYMNSNFS